MDSKTKMRHLIDGLDAAQQEALADELRAAREERRPRVLIEDITPEQMRDPKFAAEVRAELDAVLRGLR